MFTPQWVNELRLGFTREHVYFANPLQGDNVAEKVGIPFVNNPAVAYSSGLSSFSVAGFTGLGESGIQPFIVTDNNFEVTNHVTWLKGKHSLKFGGDLIRRQYNFFQSSSQRGSFSFNGQFTSQMISSNRESTSSSNEVVIPSISICTGTRFSSFSGSCLGSSASGGRNHARFQTGGDLAGDPLWNRPVRPIWAPMNHSTSALEQFNRPWRNRNVSKRTKLPGRNRISVTHSH